jgi:hypothetical protein
MRDGLVSFLGAEGNHTHHVETLGIRIVLVAPLRLPERLMPVTSVWNGIGVGPTPP